MLSYAALLLIGISACSAFYLPSQYDNAENRNKPLDGKIVYFNNGSYIVTVNFPCRRLGGCERQRTGFWLNSHNDWILESGPPQQINAALPMAAFVGQCTFDFTRTDKTDPHRNVGICYGQGKCFRRENGSMFCQPTGVRMIPYILSNNYVFVDKKRLEEDTFGLDK